MKKINLHIVLKSLCILLLLLATAQVQAQSLYQFPAGVQTRVSSFENLNGVKGNGGKTNQTAKGNAFEFLKKGESKTLLDISGEGTVQRIWMTFNRNPNMLRSLRLRMYWDQQTKPAVDVPVGDFFSFNLGKDVRFESAFFSSGEGRSFNCYIPMPFRKGARIVITNEGEETCKLFFDVDVLLHHVSDDALYFHAYWSRKKETKLGEDFELLPKVNGKGRFLGASFGLITDPSYGRKNGWCEGEVKMYMDDDTDYPTYNGTGTEDYIGSAWGLGKFVNQYQGCTVANDSTGEYSFYRWHVPDAIYFSKNIRVTLQQIGGGMTRDVRDVLNKGAKLKPISVETPQGFNRLLDAPQPANLNDPSFPEGWVNFYRSDDYSATSLFYLDQPVNQLPELSPVAHRVGKLK